MPNYKETSIEATLTKYQRCSHIMIDNPYQQQPTIHMSEQEVSLLGTDVLKIEGVGGLNFPFDPAVVVTLIDPTTNLPTGTTVTMGEVYAILYSLYIQKAAERDAS